METGTEKNIAATDTLELTTEIVAAYVSNNPVQSSDLAGLIRNVHAALNGLSAEEKQAPEAKPAIPVKKSVTDDYLICLEDGKKFKSLKRHLRAKYDMTPDEYREKWGLPFDYPMVAPSYARKRSQLAKKMGLGTGKK
ncbi:MAG: transcriptional regulator [Henriciella sp.]|uniref:MucR family transcriptional regulator n=1 Tax=Henriciella sp. TaxID=1968823 RepID=UPI000C0FA223|nr:MucR family transcriptional regulator [Henriciella sp.]MAN74096.1 transcriptional regulator [Henriciella sp.]MBF34222.1 transcriptional regulator [Hyphomonadaceae bacterium]MBK76631.1 transcriptional regulator [Henriciella sp.]PHR75599.1 MAG: transcriptional regulator [Henriciella sp.]